MHIRPRMSSPRRAAVTLTPRESEVLALLAAGLADKQAAHALGVSVHTVRSLLRRAMARTGARTRVELAARWAAGRRGDGG